mmetsp:Transcript_30424/g.78737  ORF Transcript_30424/g.78737 Transcript_30424/m.78737 type:complete len:128 (+) Transcript_30424:5137-5520(+)
MFLFIFISFSLCRTYRHLKIASIPLFPLHTLPLARSSLVAIVVQRNQGRSAAHVVALLSSEHSSATYMLVFALDLCWWVVVWSCGHVVVCMVFLFVSFLPNKEKKKKAAFVKISRSWQSKKKTEVPW